MPHHVCITPFHIQTNNPLPSAPNDNTQNKPTRTTPSKQLGKIQPHILTRIQHTKRTALAKRRKAYRTKLYTAYKLCPLSDFRRNILAQSLPIFLHESTRKQPQPPHSLHSLGWKPTNPLNKTPTTKSLNISSLPLSQNQTPTNKTHTLPGLLLQKAMQTPHNTTPTEHHNS